MTRVCLFNRFAHSAGPLTVLDAWMLGCLVVGPCGLDAWMHAKCAKIHNNEAKMPPQITKMKPKCLQNGGPEAPKTSFGRPGGVLGLTFGTCRSPKGPGEVCPGAGRDIWGPFGSHLGAILVTFSMKNRSQDRLRSRACKK